MADTEKFVTWKALLVSVAIPFITLFLTGVGVFSVFYGKTNADLSHILATLTEIKMEIADHRKNHPIAASETISEILLDDNQQIEMVRPYFSIWQERPKPESLLKISDHSVAVEQPLNIDLPWKYSQVQLTYLKDARKWYNLTNKFGFNSDQLQLIDDKITKQGVEAYTLGSSHAENCLDTASESGIRNTYQPCQEAYFFFSIAEDRFSVVESEQYTIEDRMQALNEVLSVLDNNNKAEVDILLKDVRNHTSLNQLD